MNWVIVIEFLWKWRMAIIGVVAAAVIAWGAWYIWDKGGDARQEKIETIALKEEVKVREKNAEIRNNRADDAALIKRLQSGSF